jgi:two-component system sensor histidine kinase YesM
MLERNRNIAFFLRRLALAFIPVALPLAILGVAAITVTDNFSNRELVAVSTRQLDYLKDSLETALYEMDALNLTFSANKNVIAAVDTLLGKESVSVDDVSLAQTLSDIFNAEINARPYVSSVYFFMDRHPDRIFSTIDGIVPMALLVDTEWLATYRGTPPGRTFWTEIRDVRKSRVESSTRAVFTIYRRLFPAGAARQGVIVANMDRDYFQTLISRALVFRDQEVALFDTTGSLILGSDPRGGWGPAAATAVLEDIPVLSERSNRDGRFFAYSSAMSHYGWRLVSTIPSASLKRLPITVRSLILAMLGGCLLVGMGLTFFLARRDARRVAAVVRLFERAENGGEIPVQSEPAHDEYDLMVQTLIRTFLKQRFATLQLSERQARAEVLELQALRSQMNPHFLFNTLESLYWMVFGTDGKPSKAAHTIKDLSTLLHYSMGSTDAVALAEEIEIARRYVAIQQIRYPDTFRVLWEADEAARACRVPKLILQPLLENAIQYGVQGNAAPYTIRVSAKADAASGSLLLTVEDNGVGIREGDLQSIRAALLQPTHQGDHIGLYNTHRRIQLTYGPEHGLSIESAPGAGTRVSVHLPAVSARPATA